MYIVHMQLVQTVITKQFSTWYPTANIDCVQKHACLEYK